MSYSHSSTVPIEMLPGIGRRTAKVLRSLHVTTVGQFKQLPERVLIDLFGPTIKPVYQMVKPPIARKALVSMPTPVHALTVTSAKQNLNLVQKLRLATQVLMM